MRFWSAVLTSFLLLGAVMMADDTSALKPPAGAKLAIIAFEDLQCSDCAAAEPTLYDVIKRHHIAFVRHDFNLPQHVWAHQAHLFARWFDSVSPELGEQYRHWVYTNQKSINKDNLRGMSERFAEQHGQKLPAEVDPDGKFEAMIKADFALGQAAGVQKTPTIYVVSQTQRSEPLVEEFAADDLYGLIEAMLAAAK